MEIHGRRECVACGNRWSYYETGSVTCPACGAMRSVGLDESPTKHTDTAVTLDLSDARKDIDRRTLDDVARDAETAARQYVNRRGFINGGELTVLDNRFLAATELKHVAATIHRALTVTESEETYFLELLQAADAGERPPTEELPDSLTPARGLATADAVAIYRRDLVDWLDTHRSPLPVRPTIDQLGDHVKRIEALDGDITAANADRLIAATRDFTTAVTDDDESALSLAQERLDGLF